MTRSDAVTRSTTRILALSGRITFPLRHCDAPVILGVAEIHWRDDMAKDETPTPPPHTERVRTEREEDWRGHYRSMADMMALGAQPAVAMGMLSIEASFALSTAMINSVTEQKHLWLLDRTVTVAAIDRLLRNDILGDAVDRILGEDRRPITVPD
jgi:Killing trait